MTRIIILSGLFLASSAHAAGVPLRLCCAGLRSALGRWLHGQLLGSCSARGAARRATSAGLAAVGAVHACARAEEGGAALPRAAC